MHLRSNPDLKFGQYGYPPGECPSLSKFTSFITHPMSLQPPKDPQSPQHTSTTSTNHLPYTLFFSPAAPATVLRIGPNAPARVNSLKTFNAALAPTFPPTMLFHPL